MRGKIFINYRRGDDPGFTGRLFDRLEDHFPLEQLFMDVDSIEPGLDFVKVLDEQVAGCDVLLAVIGREWLRATDRGGLRRLDKDDDFVRIEIEAALQRGIRVIPVLVNGADMPREQDLPESMRPFARRNAFRLSHEQFRSDAGVLVKMLEKALEEEAERRTRIEASAEVTEVPEDPIAAERRRIAEAEELANWEFVRTSRNEAELRDHVARFPEGSTAQAARDRMEWLAWKQLGRWPDLAEVKGFLERYPTSVHAPLVAKRREALSSASYWRLVADWFSMLVIPVLVLLGFIFQAWQIRWLDPSENFYGGLFTIFPLGLAAIVLITVALIASRGRKLTWQESVSYWLACILALGVTLPSIVMLLGHKFLDVLVWLNGLPILLARGEGQAFVVAALSPVPLLLVRWWKLNDFSISAWWLGVIGAMAGDNFLVAHTFGNGSALWWQLGITSPYDIYAGIVLTIVSAAALILLRRKTIDETAISTYWLGVILIGIVTLPFFFADGSFEYGNPSFWTYVWLGLTKREGLGWLALLVFAIVSSAILMWRGRNAMTSAAFSRYWAGCTLAAMLYVGRIFEANRWFWIAPISDAPDSDYRGYATGSLVAFLFMLAIAASVAFRPSHSGARAEA